MDFTVPDMNLGAQRWDDEPSWVRDRERTAVPDQGRERERELEQARNLEQSIRQLNAKAATNSMEKHLNAKPFEPRGKTFEPQTQRSSPYTLHRSNSDGDLRRFEQSQGFRRSYSDERFMRYSQDEPSRDMKYSSMHQNFYEGNRDAFPS